MVREFTIKTKEKRQERKWRVWHLGARECRKCPATPRKSQWSCVGGARSRRGVNLYLVPTTSPRIHHNDLAMRELEHVVASIPGERMVVLGDWNARIGEASSFVFTGEEEEQANKVDLEKEYPRTSVDKNANDTGKRAYWT